MYKVHFEFTKKRAMRYISHLDLMRLLARAMRRAGLPLKLSEGFSPHVRLSLARALKLGAESDCEQGSIVLKEFVRTDEMRRLLQEQLPDGIEVLAVHL
ncbi:MAG TPA: TIGR03936 family radical SAM-associated protein [Candidatus Omnitrophota bacterium]|nr:TIGR03936 family radical SAM-associated protein [Candidatus Omnitrophota bacterium]